MFDKEQIYTAYQALQDSCTNAEEVYANLVKSATEDLDNLMQEAYTQVVIPEDVPFEVVSRLYTKLCNYIYFIGERLEKIGLSADVSEQSMKDKYNIAYNANLIGLDGKKRTGAELVAIAEKESQVESILNDIYLRAYKTVKFKVDSAQSMVNTLSRVFSKKMQELNFSSEYDKSRLLME